MPIGCSATYALPLAWKYLASTMKTGCCRPGGTAVGTLEMNRTVYGSGVSTRSMSRTYGVCLEALAGFLIQSIVYLTSADVNGSPFENVTPRRSLYSSVVGAVRRHETARRGWYWPGLSP